MYPPSRTPKRTDFVPSLPSPCLDVAPLRHPYIQKITKGTKKVCSRYICILVSGWEAKRTSEMRHQHLIYAIAGVVQ